MPIIERDTEDLRDGRVVGALHVVEGLRDEGEVEEAIWVDVVEEAPGGAPFVAEECVRAGRVDGEVAPLVVVGGGGGGVVLGVGRVAEGGGGGGHGG